MCVRFFYLAVITLIIFYNNHTLFAQDSTILDSKRHIKAVYVDEAPAIDGVLDEAIWQKVEPVRDFTESDPVPNTASAVESEVWMVYDDNAVYFAAKLYDVSADSVLKQLSIRDDFFSVNADRFVVHIDGMFQQQNVFSFGVTAAGVQYDASDDDDVWDAVWDSKTTIVDDGWVVEMKIPYAQLRFPKSEVQTWGINFERYVRRTRERSYWSKVDPTVDGFARQFGVMEGIEGVKPPVRLSFTPYAAMYYQTQPNDPTWRFTGSAGADLKYGINESFTLDVALVPDFGDVVSDNLQFNLSPFEIYYGERRPFFTEGVALFNKGGIFYSRRVGNAPTRSSLVGNELSSDEVIDKNPTNPRLINALKVSGRTGKGLGIGVFNAVTAPTWATIRDTATGVERQWLTEPATNYNMVVFDQQFGGNSSISLSNSLVLRPKGFRSAVVTATDFRIADKKNRFSWTGNGALSQIFEDTMKVGQDRYSNGFTYNLFFNKISGNFRFNIAQFAASKDHDPNDLGFFTRTNYLNHNIRAQYFFFQPFWIYNNMNVTLELNYNRIYNPSAFAVFEIRGRANGTFKNFLSAGLDFSYQPLGFNDYFEPRTDGRYWDKPAWGRIGTWFSSDYRKPFALDGGFSYRRFHNREAAWEAAYVMSGWLEPIVRVSDRFNFSLSNETTIRNNSLGFVTNASDGSIIFGSRSQWDMINTINMNYLFNDLMSVSFRLRHYWATVEYEGFYALSDAGGMETTTYAGNHDINFNAFNVDLIYRWRFAPGSELNVVWKNSILQYGTQVIPNYFDNLSQLFSENQANQFSVKVLYFLDVNQFRKKR